MSYEYVSLRESGQSVKLKPTGKAIGVDEGKKGTRRGENADESK